MLKILQLPQSVNKKRAKMSPVNSCCLLFMKEGLWSRGIIAVKSKGCVLKFICRPDLADQHKVGFFSLDRPSQTDVTEIVDLKEMTEVLQILLQVIYSFNEVAS